MPTQKQKFALFQRLQNLGFTYDEAAQLRRIEMTLHRWAEAECGDSNDYASFSIERDEETGKPYRCVYPHTGKMTRYAIADREAGALRRLKAIVHRRNEVHMEHWKDEVLAYHQTDPRGCALYLITRAQLGDADISSGYNRGLAVCC